MKLRYQYRLFIYFAIVLIIMVAGFSIYIIQREKAHNLKAMQSELISYNTMVHHAMARDVPCDSISFQENVRLTIIDTAGNVIYDNGGKERVYSDNHINRPEIVRARIGNSGTSLRRSRTLKEEYLYYAQKYPNMYIRTALTYKTEVLPKINEDRKHLIGIVTLFISLVVFLIYITKKLSKPLASFNAFVNALNSPNKDFSKIKFTNDEFGVVGKKIINTFEQLEETKKYKQQMTQNIAHELKTPITGIKAYLETIQHDANMSHEQMMHFIDKAYSQTLRLASLINNVSTLNKIEEATDKFNIENINLLNCLKDITDEIGYKLSSNNIVFRHNINPSYNINGNYFLIYYLFKNLIDNSIEHAGANITINLDCKRNIIKNISSENEETQNETLVYTFSYTDNGKGIPEESIPRIFERFYRVEKGRSRKNGGSGLGLAIVKNAVLFHRGNITVNNLPEGGIIFNFTLQSLEKREEQ
jgi:Signal transduction histidine kinase